MSEKRNWGYYIRLIREQRRLSRNELVAASGISYKTLDKIENGGLRNVTPAIVNGLSKALGVPRMQILEAAFDIGVALNQIPIYQTFPYEIGDEPVTSINLPNIPSKNTRGFIVHGNYLESKFHDGDFVVADDSLALNAGDSVVCLMDGKMQTAKLREVGEDLWLEGKGFKIKYQDSQHVYKIVGQYVNWLNNMGLAIVAGVVGMAGLVAGVVQLVT